MSIDIGKRNDYPDIQEILWAITNKRETK